MCRSALGTVRRTGVLVGGSPPKSRRSACDCNAGALVAVLSRGAGAWASLTPAGGCPAVGRGLVWGSAPGALTVVRDGGGVRLLRLGG